MTAALDPFATVLGADRGTGAAAVTPERFKRAEQLREGDWVDFAHDPVAAHDMAEFEYDQVETITLEVRTADGSIISQEDANEVTDGALHAVVLHCTNTSVALRPDHPVRLPDTDPR